MKSRFFFTGLVVFVCFVVNYFVGNNDFITVLGLFSAAFIMQPVVLQFQMGSRALLASHLNKDGSLHKVVASPGFLTKIMAYIAALILALGFMVILKGVMMSHGSFSALIIIAIATFLLFPWLSPAEERLKEGGDKVKNDNVTSKAINELQGAARVYASFVAALVAVSILLNITLAGILSAKDVSVFVTKDIDFYNFHQIASSYAIEYSGNNEYSRSLINAFILSDQLKLAIGNMLFDVFFPEAEKVNYFYVFYFSSFLMNLVKLMPLSIGFVVFIGGVRRRSNGLQDLFSSLTDKSCPQVKRFVNRFFPK